MSCKIIKSIKFVSILVVYFMHYSIYKNVFHSSIDHRNDHEFTILYMLPWKYKPLHILDDLDIFIFFSFGRIPSV